MLLFSSIKLRCVSKNVLSQQEAMVMTQHTCCVSKIFLFHDTTNYYTTKSLRAVSRRRKAAVAIHDNEHFS